MKKGKLIIIDGTDGSGKKTQTDLLIKKLKKEGYKVALVDFPRYGEKSAALVEDYLNGKFGTAREVGPYCASILYAVDRYVASFEIKKWLKQGKIVVSNRYVTANMGHQGGKIKNRQQRKKYFQWISDLEYNIFKLPRPDLNIILHMPAAMAQQLVDKKGFRQYIGNKRDLHEADLKHLKNAEKTYLEIAKLFPKFKIIECTSNNKILTRKKIHEKIWQAVKQIL